MQWPSTSDADELCLLASRHPRPSPRRRRLADDATKAPSEMSLIHKTAFQGNLGKRGLRRQHEPLRVFDTPT
jgi:hypothetical protein